MKLEDLEAQIGLIEEKAKEERSKAIVAYCKANNKVNIGDIVEGRHGTIIKVLRITYSGGIIMLNPECCYQGDLLKNNLEPRKDGKTDSVMQSSVIRHIPATSTQLID